MYIFFVNVEPWLVGSARIDPEFTSLYTKCVPEIELDVFSYYVASASDIKGCLPDSSVFTDIQSGIKMK